MQTIFHDSIFFKNSSSERIGIPNLPAFSSLAGPMLAPAKLEKAGKLGIPILSEEEFLKKIES